jgi:hypothetical protein
MGAAELEEITVSFNEALVGYLGEHGEHSFIDDMSEAQPMRDAI